MATQEQMQRRAVLVVNTMSRRGRHLFKDAKRLLTERGVLLEATYPVRKPSRLPEIVRQTVADGHKFIIVGGGDGTISSVVDYLAFTDVLFGLLPLGTANSFARSLGIPLDLEETIDVLLNGRVARVDLGKIGEDYFANAAAIGLPSRVGQGIPHGLKRTLGRLGYLLYASYRLLRFEPFRCTLTCGGERITLDALELRIANGGYLGGVLVAEDASVHSRDLVIQVIKGRSKWTLIKAWLLWGFGSKPGDRDLEVIRTQDMLIECQPRQRVSIDGEVLARTPIRASIARAALRMMLPRESSGSEPGIHQRDRHEAADHE